jgi:hypothetical protein
MSNYCSAAAISTAPAPPTSSQADVSMRAARDVAHRLSGDAGNAACEKKRMEQ